jgi:hypothetical protein
MPPADQVDRTAAWSCMTKPTAKCFKGNVMCVWCVCVCVCINLSKESTEKRGSGALVTFEEEVDTSVMRCLNYSTHTHKSLKPLLTCKTHTRILYHLLTSAANLLKQLELTRLKE